MWLSGLNILFLYYYTSIEFVQDACGERGFWNKHSFYWEYDYDALNFTDRQWTERFDPARSRLGVLMRGYYEDTRKRTNELNIIRFTVEETFQYEVGYIMHEMYEKYKKLVEQYNKGERNRSLDYIRLYRNRKPLVASNRLIFGNEKIERTEVAQKLYFEIYHLSNMIHELTRKWGVGSKDDDGLKKRREKYDKYDAASYKAYQAEMQRKKAKYLKRLNKERNRLMNKFLKEKDLDKKKKAAKSNEHFGIDKDGDHHANDFIKEKMKLQGWQKWNTSRHNGSVEYKPSYFVHDYGWDVTLPPAPPNRRGK